MRLIASNAKSLCLLLVLGLVTTTADAALTDYAFIDIEPSSGQTEPGTIGLAANGAPANNAGGTSFGPTVLTATGGDMFSFAIDSVDWRDRGNPPATPLNQLGEDFVKDNSGMIEVTLGSIPAGVYTVTSYHLDATNSQTELINVAITDANGTNPAMELDRLTRAAGRAHVDIGDNTNELVGRLVRGTSAQFTFESNGTDDVVLAFDGSAGYRSETPLNGLNIQAGTRDDLVTGPFTPYVLIDVGPSGQDVETGAQAVTNDSGNSFTTNIVSDNGDPLTITIDNVDMGGVAQGVLGWQDRGNSPNAGTLIDLAEEHVLASAGAMRVTLDGLPADTYFFQPFFIDANNGQAQLIDVFVTDAFGTLVQQSDVGLSDTRAGDYNLDDLSTASIEQFDARFLVTSDGVNPVVLHFAASMDVGDDDDIVLAGLRIESVPAQGGGADGAVPEPATATLALIGLAGLAVRRRRRA